LRTLDASITAVPESSRVAPAAPAEPSTRTGAKTNYDDPRWRLAQRLAASRSLGRSELLSKFLLYVCDRYLTGQLDEISEQQIGMRVFGRAAGFNTADDNIVRSYARLLRRRIAGYFEHEGKDETLRLEIPRGGYLPVFTTPVTTPARPRRLGRKRLLAVAACLFCAVITLAVWRPAGLIRSRAERSHHRFWRMFFDARRDTFVVPADGGLVLLQSFSRNPVTLEAYANGSYRQMPLIEQNVTELASGLPPDQLESMARKVQAVGDRRYTSLADLGLAVRLARLPEAATDRTMIRFARDLRLEDLRSNNVILMGSMDANPWVGLFQKQMNFQFLSGSGFGGSGKIVNLHPLPGESLSYACVPGDPEQRTYGVIAFLPNLDGSGHVLLIEGINMAGTEAAGAFLFDPELMRPVLEQALPHGNAPRSFEVLLATDTVTASASRPRVLSVRIGN
jgi:hypothetical protein